MISLNLIRFAFIIVCVVIAYSFGGENAIFGGGNSFMYALGGGIIGISIVIFEMLARRVSLKGLSSGVFGILLGLILGKMFNSFLIIFNLPEEIVSGFTAFIYIICVKFINKNWLLCKRSEIIRWKFVQLVDLKKLEKI